MIRLNDYINTNNTKDLSSFYEQDENLTSYAIRTMNELNKEYYNNKTQFIRSIYECGNNEQLITESFDTFFGKASDIIKKFLDLIKSLFDKFILQLNKFIKNDKYVKSNKSQLSKFSKENEFEYNGYRYTFDSNIPLIFAETEFKEDFYDILKPGYTIKNIKDQFSIKLQEDYYDKFRAQVLCKSDQTIQAEDYDYELFIIFRDNAQDKEDFTVSIETINESLSRFLEYSKIEKQVQKEKDTIEKQYNNIKNYIKSELNTSSKREELLQSIIKADKDNRISITNIDTEFDTLLKMKTDQILAMSNIHSISFAAKLEAMKSCMAQDKTILYKALAKVSKSGNIKESTFSGDDNGIVEDINYLNNLLFGSEIEEGEEK